MDSISTEKPKKVLTEAQRLAFLKGREKRMANLEKKKLADLEIASASVSPSPKKTTVKRQTNAKPVIIPDQHQEPEPEVKPEPEKESIFKQDSKIDPDEIVDRIMKRLPDMMGNTLMDKFMAAIQQDSESKLVPEKPKRKRATSDSTKLKQAKPKTQPSTPPPVNNFTWM